MQDHNATVQWQGYMYTRKEPRYRQLARKIGLGWLLSLLKKYPTLENGVWVNLPEGSRSSGKYACFRVSLTVSGMNPGTITAKTVEAHREEPQ